jgi:hypothetical protein
LRRQQIVAGEPWFPSGIAPEALATCVDPYLATPPRVPSE